ncbi:ribosomal protein S5 domain 2-type protein [Vararia minispora EC-137]|uniref:Ribosomal protein S5 domain 2-type protein n=1 Tax=Vararia minispora EC-137 TaxID=1314806 RepID=A0ACB8QTG2_9AGAM|nr:ribosomal protein S5 domain 2-type protein [Vararia minispora EC-137]
MATVSLSKAEVAYIKTSLEATPPLRSDGRGLYDYRTIALETGVAPLANGSAHLKFGQASEQATEGTEVIAAARLEVEDVESGEGVNGGRISCTVSCSPSAYPHSSAAAIEDIQHDYTALLHEVISHPSLRPSNLSILRDLKSWLLNLDILVLSDAGNIYDALFVAAQAALWDTKVPRTRTVEYSAATSKARVALGGSGDMDVDSVEQSGFNVRDVKTAADFELEDYWDEGEPLRGGDAWPVCVTLNLYPPLYYLDATSTEEVATPSRLLVMYSFPADQPPRLQGMRLLGPSEIGLPLIKTLTQTAQTYATDLSCALRAKLKDEDLRRTEKARQRFASVR